MSQITIYACRIILPPTHSDLVWSSKINSCTVNSDNKAKIDEFLTGLADAHGVYLMTKVKSVPSPESKVGIWGGIILK